MTSLEAVLSGAWDAQRAMAQLNRTMRAGADAADRLAWALDLTDLRMEVNAYMLEANHRGVRPAARQAGLEARFYMRGALDPRFADQDRAGRYVRALARRHRGAAVAFMRGLAERTTGRPELSHRAHAWPDTNVQAVIR